MSEPAPRLLFVPVSGAFGRGEYARSLAIAQAAQGRWPDSSIRFIVSREAEYARDPPFPVTLLASSPTFHSGAVIEILQDWRPDAVIFDNAGRTAQLRAARRCGARVIYISARPRQRRKAFRTTWMRLIDEHWIAYPEFIAGGLGTIERLKIALLHRPTIRYLDVVMARRGPQDGATLPAHDAVLPHGFVLFVPGGGTGNPGSGQAGAGRSVFDRAGAQFLAAARLVAGSGVATVIVGGLGDAVAQEGPSLRVLGSLPQSDLAELMRGARLIVANGGSTLLQAIACGKPCVAVPIAGDQAQRIGRCVRAGVAVAAPLDSAAIGAAAMALLQDDEHASSLAARAAALGLADGIDVALRALGALLDA